MGKVIVELPCNIGDYVYEILADMRAKEVYFERHVVQDVSINGIKYCDDWKNKDVIGSLYF